MNPLTLITRNRRYPKWHVNFLLEQKTFSFFFSADGSSSDRWDITKSSSRGGMRPGRGGNWGLPRRLERLQEGAKGTFVEEMVGKGKKDSL
ncbi:hypothetical protein CEXT_515001 [Caerostris extrusa]|uniref:Uncharacterized protein n=1 Tax=Caerostris extrusa TaxID=172846 RepID=A0AAV4SXA6_CAEEX|nr:hypothetical protein CEXT_515001 [Caerostris extrusa]